MPKNVQIGPLNLCQRSNMLSAHVRCQAAMPMPSLGAWSPAFGCPSAGWAGGRWAVAPLHCPDLGRFPCGRRPWGDGATPGPEETQKRAPPTPGYFLVYYILSILIYLLRETLFHYNYMSSWCQSAWGMNPGSTSKLLPVLLHFLSLWDNFYIISFDSKFCLNHLD